MTPFLVHQFLERAAQTTPEKVFTVYNGRRSTYGEIETHANRLARLLLRERLAPRDRVGLLARNSPTYVEAYYGILKAGGVVVPLNTATNVASIRDQLEDCEARMLITDRRSDRHLATLASIPQLTTLLCPDPMSLEMPRPEIRRIGLDEAAAESSEPVSIRRIDLDLASIIYTSGSTGRSRGAMLSHLNLVANTRSIVDYLHLRPDDSVLNVLPFYYVYGKSLLNTHAAVGGKIVIENRFLFPETALDTLEHEACTGLSGVPSTYAILLNRSSIAQRKLPHLRYVTQAGGAMSPALTRRLAATLPGKQIYVMYGATEAGARLTYLDPHDLPRKVGSIGKAIPNVALRVLDEEGQECGIDEPGEIVARGSNLMSGYWNDPEETAKVLCAEGYRTGDLGRRDAEGFFYVVGRKKEMIKAGAHRISPKEIEEAILEHTDVHEAAVIGVQDEILEEAIHAFVVFRPGSTATATDLEKFLERRLPAYKMPSRYEIRGDLPKSGAGKILKASLRS